MPKLRLFVIPHTHYDAEVFITRDATLKIGADNLLDVLYLLDRDPDFRFTLDQRCYVEGFATIHPEQMERMKAHVASGRLEMAGAMHVMPDSNLPAGESLVRQILYGRAYFDTGFGIKNRNGWMLDSFGHNPQMPQIMRLGGFETYSIQRGVAEPNHPVGFWWVGIDGSRVRVEWMPHTYALIGFVPETFTAFQQVIEHIARVAQPYIYNNQFAALSGFDLSAPQQQLPDFIRRYNALSNQIELVLATAEEYFQAQPTDTFVELRADLNPLFTGCYAARITLKQQNRALENALFTAEKLMAINQVQAQIPAQSLDDAWEPVLFNQFHDIICGSHLDEIYEHALSRNQGAANTVRLATERALDALTAQIDTRGEGLPLVVFNPLAYERRDVVRCTIGLAAEKWEWLALTDGSNDIPVQLDEVQRYADGSIKRADLSFIATVPSLGWRTYHLHAGTDQPCQTDLWTNSYTRTNVPSLVHGNLRPDEGWMGNRLVDVAVNTRTGVIQRIHRRDIDWEVVDSHHPNGFASICRQEDRGDPWEYYGPLRGNITSTYPLVDPVPNRGEKRAIFSDEYGGNADISGGPVMGEIKVKQPFGDGKFNFRVRLYAGLARIEIETHLINQRSFVRYRNVFPLNLQNPRITYEIPFGALERPEGEYPAQNWVDVSDGTYGVALLNRGIPGHSLVGNVLTSSLMKCTKVVDYSAGGYSPAARDVRGFEIGVDHYFEQAILPHAGNWQSSQVYREGMAFNVPLILRKATVHSGTLPSSGSFVSLNSEHMMLHALYAEGDKWVLRVVEAQGEAIEGKLSLRWPLRAAHATDFLGENASPLPVIGNTFAFNANPFEIKTFQIEF
jgi:alpha-mannosidase